jgi:competence protein ComEA
VTSFRDSHHRLRHVVAPGVAELPAGVAPADPAVDAAGHSPAYPSGDPPGDPVASSREPAGRPTLLPGPGPFDPGRRGVRALAVVAVLVVVVAAVLAWRARPSAEPVPMPVPAAAPPLDGVEPASTPTAPARAELVVSVSGRVRRPGLVRLPAGARVADAIEAAGGLLPGTDVAFVNLARRVVDGELILVGVTAPPGVDPAPGGPGAATGPAGPGPAGPVNLNTATPAQLDALPGVGPVLAQRIIDHRERHGAFRAVGDLRQVDGIGEARYEQLKELVTV